jgi:hypothetical protein
MSLLNIKSVDTVYSRQAESGKIDLLKIFDTLLQVKKKRFMIRHLEKRFKNILTMNVVVGSVMMAGAHAADCEKMRF